MRVLSLLLGFVLLVAVGCTETFPTEENSSSPVTESAKTNYVPSTDITDQLRSDLLAGFDVTLPAGHFFVSESIVVYDYSGIVKGAGKDATIIEAAPGFEALPDPSLWNALNAGVLAFYSPTGDIVVKSLSILVSGPSPVQAHDNLFIGTTTTMANAIVVMGNEITVTLKDLRITGEDSDDPLSYNDKNLVYPVVVGAWRMGADGGTGTIDAVIKNCEVEGVGGTAIEHFASLGGSADLIDNVVRNSNEGIWLGWGLFGSQVEIKHNEFWDIGPSLPIMDWGFAEVVCKDNSHDGTPIGCAGSLAGKSQLDSNRFADAARRMEN